MNASTTLSDVVIIGAGPVGLFAVFECGMLGLKTHVIDALPHVGGQCSALYPEKPIYDIPGFPSVSGQDLIENLSKQAAPFNPIYHLNQQVEKIERQDADHWKVTTSASTEIITKTIIIAAGVGAFGPNRPPLENLEIFEKTGSVQYSVFSREKYRDKKIVIAGGGDSAVDWALSLSTLAKKITLVHRRPKFRAAPESERQLKELVDQGVIDLVVPYQLKALEGKEGHLEGVVVESFDDQSLKTIPADVLLPFYGLKMNLGPILEWGLNLDKNHVAIDPLTCATSLDGIYAVGDIATYPHKLKLILTGFAEGAQAAHSIRSFLHPQEVFHFEYSTTRGVPKIA